MSGPVNEDPGSGALPLRRGQYVLVKSDPMLEAQVEETRESVLELCNDVDGEMDMEYVNSVLPDESFVAVHFWRRGEKEEAYGRTRVYNVEDLIPLSRVDDLHLDMCSAMCNTIGYCDAGCENERRTIPDKEKRT